MKKIFAIIVSVLFAVSLFVVVACKQEAQKPAEAPKVEAPAAQPAPAAPSNTATNAAAVPVAPAK